MEIIKRIFDEAALLTLRSRDDSRGNMTVVFDESISEIFNDFFVKENRTYSMPRKGTFFGIHYKDESDPMDRLVSVVKGSGEDYIIDLRKDSPTYLEWESFMLSDKNAHAVYIPSGFGHAFLSLEEDTVLMYSMNRSGDRGFTKKLNYKDEHIKLKLPIPVCEIADYDKDAPFLDDIWGDEDGV
ncbi:MAG: dTDP-4-dehydrorhamnose 3,5-epimerase family protein [Lachnospiraceae bacterium]|nr:dTDP-4-dehydrorhamnose 3,5-epimerase family protein [Lachnospiraceae bacterium]